MSTENGSLRVQIIAVGILFIVFIMGIATGAAVVYLTREKAAPIETTKRPPPLAALRGIDVTPDEGEQIHQILDKYHPKFDGALQQIFPQVHALQEQMSHEVRSVLTPEQQKQYDANEARLPFQERMPRPPPGGGPPGRRPPPFGGPPPGEGPPPDGAP